MCWEKTTLFRVSIEILLPSKGSLDMKAKLFLLVGGYEYVEDTGYDNNVENVHFLVLIKRNHLDLVKR